MSKIRKYAAPLALFLLAFFSVFATSCGREHVHEWGPYEPFLEPTCFVAGQERSVCSCGKARYREISVSHNFVKDRLDIENRATVYVCTVCGTEQSERLTTDEAGMPIVSLDGPVSGMTSENRVPLGISYEGLEGSFDASCFARIENRFSPSFPRKDYAIELEDGDGEPYTVTLDGKLGEVGGFSLIANYIDSSSLRNVLSAKLYGEIAKTRDKDDKMSRLVNCGATDGYPVLVYLNGEFLGLYTLNVTEDESGLGMTGDPGEAILFANGYTDQSILRAPLSDNYEHEGIELIYTSGGDKGAAIDSFNRMINFINADAGFAFKQGAGGHVDVERAIDGMLFTYLTGAVDNVSKNILWVTYDGEVWIPVPHNLSGTWGLKWDGDEFISPGTVSPGHPYNELWRRFSESYYYEASQRWAELRRGPVTVENIERIARELDGMISDDVRDADAATRSEHLTTDKNNVEQIISFTRESIAYLDEYYGYIG